MEFSLDSSFFYFFSCGVMNRRTLPDFPPRSRSAGTSLVTTLPAPTIAFSPIVTLARIVAPEPIELPSYHRASPPSSPLRSALPVCGRGPRIGVVDERHAMADEDVVFDVHSFANKSMAGNLAVPADAGVFLNLDERADLCFVADLASIEIDEFRKLHVFAEFHVRRDAADTRSQRHQLAALSQRFFGGLEQPHHPQAGTPSLNGFLFS